MVAAAVVVVAAVVVAVAVVVLAWVEEVLRFSLDFPTQHPAYPHYLALSLVEDLEEEHFLVAPTAWAGIELVRSN